MTHNFECKKDALRQTQDGIWKLTLTVLPEDMPMELLQAPMGSVYGLAMVPIDYDNPEKPTGHNLSPVEKSEGEKLRIRACILCGEREFQIFCESIDKEIIVMNKDAARTFIVLYCNIKSRSELTTDVAAQEKFRELDQKFKDWQYADRYEDNLSRE